MPAEDHQSQHHNKPFHNGQYHDEPLVSVVTPVYNTEKYIAECIKSVLAQSYGNWEYVIVNNCSTDGTLTIVEEYARRDARIRVVNNSEFLPLIANWNHALRQISPQSQFVKTVHADDWLFPECIARMVAVAVEHPNVGMVSAYRLNENRVDLDGLPYPSTVIDGRTAGRLSFGREPLFLFGSPTSTLLRADLVRARENFYDDNYLHADTDASFRILQSYDLGFVHQILTYTRRHNESVTSKVKRLETIYAEMVGCFLRYGPSFFDEAEFRQRRKEIIASYYHLLGHYLFEKRDPEFWAYHRKNLAELGIPFERRQMVRPLFLESMNALIHLKTTLRRAFAKPRQRNHQHDHRRQIVQGN